MVLVVDSTSVETADLFLADVNATLAAAAANERDQQPFVAFDCEGVNLSRAGSVEIVSMHFGSAGTASSSEVSDEVFLIDLGEQNRIQPSVCMKLKELLESKSVVKVIHDTRMDSDALFHLHGIKVKNIHDTQSFHAVLSGREDVNLNDMLSYNGIEENGYRDKSIYKSNPNFWVSRPLTEKMKDWASTDVDKLLIVAKKQLVDIDTRGVSSIEKAQTMSAQNCTVRDMQLARHVTCNTHVGKFIGRGGMNLRSLQKRTGTIIYSEIQGRNKFMIFYRNQTSLDSVKNVMGHHIF